MKELNKFQGVWNGDAEIGKNPLFQATFWGFLGFSEEEKGPQMENMEKIYLLNILYTHQARQIWFSEIFPEVHSLGDSQFG
jgi:hypothetical protein